MFVYICTCVHVCVCVFVHSIRFTAYHNLDNFQSKFFKNIFFVRVIFVQCKCV